MFIGVNYRQVAYQRGNQKEASPHYVFLYSDDEGSENEEYPMKVSSSESRPRKIEVINVEIQSEDTLQALALRYRCSVSTFLLLKNNLQTNDNNSKLFMYSIRYQS